MKWIKIVCVAILPTAAVCADSINYVTAPTEIIPGEKASVEIDYQADAARDYAVYIKRADDTTYYAWLRRSVASGSRTETFYFNVKSESPLGTDYTLSIRVLDPDGGWSPVYATYETPVAVVSQIDPTTNEAPVANAGEDQTVILTEGDSTASVTLDGSASSDSDGTIDSYRWTEGETVLGSGQQLAANLNEGKHTIKLTVTDNENATGIDTVIVTVQNSNLGDSISITKIEPSSSGNLVLSWSKGASASSYTVEAASQLTESAFAPISPQNQWPINETTWTYNMGDERSLFFRIVGNISDGFRPGLWYGTVFDDINITEPNPMIDITIDLSETENEIAENTTEVYTGRIYDEDGNISFTEHIDDRTRLYIDGILVLSDDDWQTRKSTANLRLTPGWHDFELRISNGIGGSGPVTYPGFGYDPNGGTNWIHPLDHTGQSLFRVDSGDEIINDIPMANAGPDQTITLAQGSATTPAMLDGSASSDSDGTLAAYRWTMSGTLIGKVAQPTVNLTEGLHKITLRVRDNDGAADTDTVFITVESGQTTNAKPTANAGPDQTVTLTQGSATTSVALNGTGSSDSDGMISLYRWTENGSLIGSGAQPTISLSQGAHTIILQVTDNDGTADTDTVVITVESGQTVNVAPTASAGPDQTVTLTQGSSSASVSLNGSASSDPDGTITSYRWIESGSLIGTSSQPTVSLSEGTHTITLRVRDNENATDTDTVYITVEPGQTTNVAPTANAGPDQTATLAQGSTTIAVSLDGSASDDSDGTISAYRWTENDVLVGSGTRPSVNLNEGKHTITLRVTDNENATNTDTVVITVNAPTPSGGIHTTYPGEYPTALANALKGMRPSNPNFEDYYNTLRFDHISWNELEMYETDTVSDILRECQERWTNQDPNDDYYANTPNYNAEGLRIIPHINVVPWVQFDNGNWGAGTPEDGLPDGLTAYDYNNFTQKFQDRMVAFIAKLGEAWNDDPRIPWINIGFIGTGGSHENPSLTDYQQTVLRNAFNQYFPNKKLIMNFSNDFPHDEYGIYNRSWAHPNEIGQENDINNLNKNTGRWKVAPITGQLSYYSLNAMDGVVGRNADETLGNANYLDYLMDVIRKNHCTALGSISDYAPNNSTSVARASEVQMALGYRFVVTEANWNQRVNTGETLNFSFKVVNKGSAPFYYDWPVELLLLDPNSKEIVAQSPLSGIDIRDWLSGDDWDSSNNRYRTQAQVITESSSITVPSDLQNGKYIVALAIIDPLTGKPSMRLAINNYFNGNIHPFGYVGIGMDITDGFNMNSTDFDDPNDNAERKAGLAYEIGGNLGSINTPPTINWVAPSSHVTIRDTEAVTLTVDITDEDTNSCTVRFYDGSRIIRSLTAAPWRIVLSSLSVGNHTITAVVTDSKGLNTTTASSRTITVESSGGSPDYLAPVDVDYANGQLYVLAAEAQQLIIHNTSSSSRSIVNLPGRPTGLVVDGSTVYVTGGGNNGQVWVVQNGTLNNSRTMYVGHTPMSPVISGNYLYVCNRFSKTVQKLDKSNGQPRGTATVEREPYAAAISSDGTKLFVANHLPIGTATSKDVHAVVSNIQVSDMSVSNIALPNGSEGLRGIAISDGRVYVTHLIAHHQIPTTQMERGWLNSNALTLINESTGKRIETVLLDDLNKGFANPASIGFIDPDTMVIASPSAHELSIIDVSDLISRINERSGFYGSFTMFKMYNDNTFMARIGRKRVKLQHGLGPRSMVINGSTVYLANYFSDNVESITFNNRHVTRQQEISFVSSLSMPPAREGEMFFNDSRFCFQNWLSCVTCHPDARSDGLNWDLMNDGIGSFKNAKSMVYAHETAPAMWTGIRQNAEVAVHAGLTFIQMSIRSQHEEDSVNAYLSGLEAETSPYRTTDGTLTPAAQNGEQVFNRIGCNSCHKSEVHYAESHVDEPWDRKGTPPFPVHFAEQLETPQLSEVWRTAPYGFDGRAETMEQFLNQHGAASLDSGELDDLVKFVLSL